nr:non-specific phospholipase C1 isoform X2 [Arachis hypogaea]
MNLRRSPFPLPTLLLLFLLLSPISATTTANLHRKKTHTINGPIKTVVVLVMENRSFDHVLGWLKKTRPDIDGLTGTESNRITANDLSSPSIPVTDDAIFIDSDPGHSFQAIREQIFGSNDTSANPAPMNGFAQQAENQLKGMSRTVMSGFKPERLPIYTELANEFGVFDKWFASVPASTQPNRFYVHSATSHGAMSNVRKDLIEGFPQRTIFDSLNDNGLTFGIYYQNIPATLFFKSLRKIKNVVNFHSYALKFKSHAKKGKLPNYVVVEQRYFDVKLSPANDDHPSHDVAEGQRFVKEVYEILRKSPQWKEMAILITYDEHGGFYDHVPTPVEGVPNPDGIIGPDPYYFRFNRLGVRVPTFLISPWIEKGTETLADVSSDLRPFGAREDTSLSEFQVELIQLASQLNGDHVLNSYPNIGKTMTVREANKYAEDAVKRFLEAGKAALKAGANESAIVTMRPSLTSRVPVEAHHGGLESY